MSLSDKRGVLNLDESGEEMYGYHEQHVREAVKELKEFIGTINDFEKQNEEIQDKIDEIFGEKLS